MTITCAVPCTRVPGGASYNNAIAYKYSVKLFSPSTTVQVFGQDRHYPWPHFENRHLPVSWSDFTFLSCLTRKSSWKWFLFSETFEILFLAEVSFIMPIWLSLFANLPVVLCRSHHDLLTGMVCSTKLQHSPFPTLPYSVPTKSVIIFLLNAVGLSAAKGNPHLL